MATGVSTDERRKVFGCAVSGSEQGAFWTALLRTLEARGLRGTHSVITEAHVGLKSAIAHMS